MKIYIPIAALLFLMSGYCVFAENPFIPKPELTIQELAAPATSQFLKWCTENKEKLRDNQASDSFFLAKLEYTNVFLGAPQGKWIWVATFESFTDASQYYTFIVGGTEVVPVMRTTT